MADSAVTKGGNLKTDEWLHLQSGRKSIAGHSIRSLKNHSISNAMDGSEDDAIFEKPDDESNQVEDDNIQTDLAITDDQFQKLFGDSDSVSSFEGFS